MISPPPSECLALASRFAAEAIRHRVDPMRAILERVTVAFDFIDPDLMTVTVDAVTLSGGKIRGSTNMRPCSALYRYDRSEVDYTCDYLANMIATTLHRTPGPPYPLPASLGG